MADIYYTIAISEKGIHPEKQSLAMGELEKTFFDIRLLNFEPLFLTDSSNEKYYRARMPADYRPGITAIRRLQECFEKENKVIKILEWREITQ